MSSKFPHEQRMIVRYFIEFFAIMLSYAVVLVISIDLGRPMHAGVERTLIEVSPMIPILLMIIVIARQFKRMDEYLRLQMLGDIAIAAAVTSGWTFTYGFLENTGFPRLSMFTVLPAMFGVWGFLAIFRSLSRR